MRYSVQPGLYAVNLPGPESPVFVSANYKLSFDHLRRALKETAAWILVLDTRGINVWCAAGKGTFGTEELINRIDEVHLKDKVTHRQLIVPQLGAPGVAAHKILQQSGFRVIYGPVRARDIPRFLDANMEADTDMRRVQFQLTDRLAVAPVETIGSIKKVIILALVFALIAARRNGGWSLQHLYQEGLLVAVLVLAHYLIVTVLIPALLPWLPGRAFCVKGVGAGLLTWIILWASRLYTQTSDLLAWLLLFVTVSAFMGLNFTGASTYTSLSGVKKETRMAVPWIIAGLLTSAVIWFWSCGKV
jgi:acetyl-CoA decarbonylase/synthase complex subunit gamma